MSNLEWRRRVALAFVISLVLTRSAFPQDSHMISGRVTDASGAVIVGASVTVTGPHQASRQAVSDGRGEFSVAGLPSGEFVVHVERERFAPADVKVALSEASPRPDVRVVLQPAGLSETLTVVGAPYAQIEATTASKVPLPQRQLPQSVSVLTRAQMNDQNMVTPWDALSQMTGVTAVSYTDNQPEFYARGAMLEFQLDGAPSAQPLSTYQQYDLAIYERIEVQRGPAGVLQGPGAFAGAVNLVRRRPSPHRSVSAFVNTGQWNNYHAEAHVSGPLTGSLRGLAVVAATDRNFFYDRAGHRTWLGYGVLEWSPAPATRVGAMIIRQNDGSTGFSGLPTYTDGQFLNVPRSFNPSPEWNRRKSGTTDIGFEIEHRFGPAWTLLGKVNRRDQEFMIHDAFVSSAVDRTTQTLTYSQRELTANYTSDTADAYLNGRFRALGSAHQWLVGANVARFQGVSRRSNDPSLRVQNISLASPPAVPEPPFTYQDGIAFETLQSGLYTMLRTRVGTRLSTVVGGSWANVGDRFRSVEPAVATDWAIGVGSTMKFTPHAGAVVDVTGALSLYASYSEIFAVQQGQYVDGRALEPREGGQWEVGAKGEHRNKRLLTAVAAFQIRDRNRAYPDSGNPGFFVPLGEVESRGWEAEVTGRVSGEWDLSAGYTWLETKYLTHQTLVGQPLSYWYPKHSLKAWSNWRVPATFIRGLKFGVGVQAYSSSASGTDRRNAAGAVTVAARRQGAYAVASANVSYPLRRSLQVGAQVNNLFDRTYYTRLGGTNGFNWFGEPRNAAVFLRWHR